MFLPISWIPIFFNLDKWSIYSASNKLSTDQNIFKELLPDIVIRVVKNAGHIIVHDNFDAFTKEVVEFIKSV